MSLDYTYAKALNFSMGNLLLCLNYVYIKECIEDVSLLIELQDKPLMSWSIKSSVEIFSACDVYTLCTASRLMYYIKENHTELERLAPANIVDKVYSFYLQNVYSDSSD